MQPHKKFIVTLVQSKLSLENSAQMPLLTKMHVVIGIKKVSKYVSQYHLPPKMELEFTVYIHSISRKKLQSFEYTELIGQLEDHAPVILSSTSEHGYITPQQHNVSAKNL